MADEQLVSILCIMSARSYVREFDCLETDGKVLLCRLCSVSVKYDQRSHVTQHLRTKKHEENAKLNARSKQCILATNIPSRAEKWAEVIMTSGLPYSIIEREPFRSFIEKEVGYKLPSESSIRKN